MQYFEPTLGDNSTTFNLLRRTANNIGQEQGDLCCVHSLEWRLIVSVVGFTSFLMIPTYRQKPRRRGNKMNLVCVSSWNGATIIRRSGFQLQLLSSHHSNSTTLQPPTPHTPRSRNYLPPRQEDGRFTSSTFVIVALLANWIEWKYSWCGWMVEELNPDQIILLPMSHKLNPYCLYENDFPCLTFAISTTLLTQQICNLFPPTLALFLSGGLTFPE